ncbi:hypothetical protein [Actinoplanes sp. NPDC048796]|uniref:hypothetical protein n=1 Tax=Actinoplanes sp. NPDC048796 TaxID=3155640 RepID=UPI003401F69E
MAAALILAPGLVTGFSAPAWAGGPAVSAITTTTFDQFEEDRLYVRYLASYDPRSLVRTAAWNALVASNVPAAIERFLNSGLAYAVTRSQQLAARNADFARRILATHTAEYSPEVHAAAQYALNSGTSALDAFAKTGYAAAKERDRVAREAAGEQVAALLETDRLFVAHLRDHDPGAQVRAAAGYALRVGATDADLVEFYAYDWAAAAAVDLQNQKMQCTNSDMVWRAKVKTLLADALAAQKAAEEAADEAREQARAAAARAWHALGEQAAPAKSTWDTAVVVAEQQAANWQEVALAAAAAADNPNWDSIALSAQTNGQQWTTEQANAAKQAAYWTALYEMALAGEQDMQAGAR